MMTDYPVFIPTSEGPMGGIVSEPTGEARAAIVLLPGAGRPGRSGTGSFWTRVARALAARGLVVLRVDYSREGETLPIGEGGRGMSWKRNFDRFLLRQALLWFRRRLNGLDLLLAGSCSGARGAIELAGAEPGAISGTFLVVPYIRIMEEVEHPSSVDPVVVECFRAILAHAPSWILTGEQDSQDVTGLQRLLGQTRHPLEVETVPEVALHFLDQPFIQDQTEHRLVERIEAALAAPLSAAPIPPSPPATGSG